MDSVWADPARHAGLTGARQAQKKMFGGLAVLLDGTMAVGVYGDDLLVRTDPGQQDMLLAEPGTRLST
jgi:TfoX/Sxy family transcriptional regulator of competence genes